MPKLKDIKASSTRKYYAVASSGQTILAINCSIKREKVRDDAGWKDANTLVVRMVERCDPQGQMHPVFPLAYRGDFMHESDVDHHVYFRAKTLDVPLPYGSADYCARKALEHKVPLQMALWVTDKVNIVPSAFVIDFDGLVELFELCFGYSLSETFAYEFSTPATHDNPPMYTLGDKSE